MSCLLSAPPKRWAIVCHRGFRSRHSLPRDSCSRLAPSASALHTRSLSSMNLTLGRCLRLAAAPSPHLTSRRHLRVNSETQTRDFYGIEVELAERSVEKEKWRRILAQRVEQEALASGPEVVTSGETVFGGQIALGKEQTFGIEDASSSGTALNTKLPSILTSSPLPVISPPRPPPPPPAPAASMSLRDFNLEPRRARTLRKKAALDVPFDPDVTTLLPSGIKVRFDANNRPMDPYPDEPLQRPPKVVSLVGALAPLASVDEALRSVGDAAESRRLTAGGGAAEGMLEGGRRVSSGPRTKLRWRDAVETSVEEKNTTEISEGVSTAMSAESASDMNFFDEQMMLAQFDLVHSGDSTKDFHADLERMSREKSASEEIGLDEVKMKLIEDSNYFDQLYIENSDFRGLKLSEEVLEAEARESESGDLRMAIHSKQIDAFHPSSSEELNFFDQQMFESFDSTTKMTDAAAFVDSVEEVTSFSQSASFATTSISPPSSFSTPLSSPSSPLPSLSTPSTSSKSTSISSSPSSSLEPVLSEDLVRDLRPKLKFHYKPEEAPAMSPHVKGLIRRRVQIEADSDLIPAKKSILSKTKNPSVQDDKVAKNGESNLERPGKTGQTFEDRNNDLISNKKKDPLMPPALRGEKRVDSKGFRKYSDMVADLKWASLSQLTELLHRRVIFNADGLVAVDKPFGLPCQQGPNLNNTVDDILPLLADALGHKSLKSVHRLDQTTTGVLIFAADDKTMTKVKAYFAERRVLKVYYALVKGRPQLDHGSIKIPLMDFKLESGYRTMVAPSRYKVEEDTLSKGMLKDLIDRADLKRLAGKPKESFDAVTNYEVLDSNNGISLLEVQPHTGFKHQIRAHLAYGLNTPIIGDHKYSHTDALKPQRLPGPAIQALNTRQPLARHIPLQLHAKSIVLPEFNSGRNVFISANLPFHFKEMLRLLKIDIPKIKGGTSL